MRCFVVAGFLLTIASRGPSATAEPLVRECSFVHALMMLAIIVDTLSVSTIIIIVLTFRFVRFALQEIVQQIEPMEFEHIKRIGRRTEGTKRIRWPRRGTASYSDMHSSCCHSEMPWSIGTLVGALTAA